MQGTWVVHRDSVHAPVDDDLALVLAAQTDPRSFAGLYRRYRDRVCWYVRTRTTTDQDAEDLTQQIFTRALVHSLPGCSPLRGTPWRTSTVASDRPYPTISCLSRCIPRAQTTR